jgi:tRNA(Ser,Leu) C12 N-acetylase TAN1
MKDWNVVISIREGFFKEACVLLEQFGAVSKTGFFNVLVMRVEDTSLLVEKLREQLATETAAARFLARVMPVTQSFNFQDPAMFEEKARETVSSWIPALAAKGFHVRMHRRGFKGRLSSMEEERFLDDFILAALEQAGSPGHITFEDPDAVIVVETVGQRAGLSLWTREELRRYPFLHPD